MSDFKLLTEKMRNLNLPYADAGMEEVCENLQVAGIAFFPVGRGLLSNGEDLPKGRIMILGQDFGTIEYAQKLPPSGENLIKNPTWRNLLKLIGDAKISGNECFFTNAIMGVRAQGGNITGKSTGMKHPLFRKKCQDFFMYQLEIQEPATIWALGIEVMKFLIPLSKQMNEKWGHISSLKSLDEISTPLLKSVRFDHNINFQPNVLVLTHPCIWSNVIKRTFNGIKGEAAILDMMRQSLVDKSYVG